MTTATDLFSLFFRFYVKKMEKENRKLSIFQGLFRQPSGLLLSRAFRVMVLNARGI